MVRQRRLTLWRMERVEVQKIAPRRRTTRAIPPARQHLTASRQFPTNGFDVGFSVLGAITIS